MPDLDALARQLTALPPETRARLAALLTQADGDTGGK
jgi:hypothetical protein